MFQNDDFSISAERKFVKKMDDHDRDISDIDKRVKFLEGSFGDHKKTACTLSDTVKESTSFQDIFTKEVMIKKIESDASVRAALKNLYAEFNKNNFFWLLTKMGFVFYSICMLVIGALITKHLP